MRYTPFVKELIGIFPLSHLSVSAPPLGEVSHEVRRRGQNPMDFALKKIPQEFSFRTKKPIQGLITSAKSGTINFSTVQLF